MGNEPSFANDDDDLSDSDSPSDRDMQQPQDSGTTTIDGERIRTAKETVEHMIAADSDTSDAVMRDDTKPPGNNQSTSTEQASAVVHPPQPIAAVERVPVQFVWTHGGHEIFVVYSGDGWSRKHRMHKSFHDFSLILEVPPDTYYYKFIVDNQWRCAPDQEHVRDIHGAYSNKTVVRPQSVVSFIEEAESGTTKKRGRHGSIDLLTDKDYSQNLPDPESYISEPPVAPPQLGHILLNHPTTRDNHPLVLDKPQHVNLNHLYVADKRDQEVVTFGITQRFREKYFTTVYYKPIDMTEQMSYGGREIVDARA